MIIDAHQHFWQLSQPFEYGWLAEPQHKAINRDFLPEHLRDHINAAGVDKTIFVQTQHNVEENRWVLEMARTNDFIAGVVGWVDLANEDCEKQLAEFVEHPKFVGIRHVTQDETDDDFIIRPDVVRGLKVLAKHNVPFDLLFYVKHLKHVGAIAESVPNLRMVINHLSKPNIKGQGFDDWIDDFKRAAGYPNVYCKLSGMITEADWESWKPADLKPYVDAALEQFGPTRCMFGSDWPVCELAGSYNSTIEALRECAGELSADELDAIFCQTAKTFYDLEL